MIRFAEIFSDHMVLLRDEEIVVWGVCDAGDTIIISIDGLSAACDVYNGKWEVKLPPHSAGGPYTMTASSGDCVIELEDILYGDVFVAAGQSNMEMALEDCISGKFEMETADYDNIRYYNTIKTGYIDDEVEKRLHDNSWQKCIKKGCGQMSAIAFYAARTLHDKLNIPIGIIDCYQGGTSISSWLPTELLKEDAGGMKYIEEYDLLVSAKTDEEYEKEVLEYWEKWHEWDDKVKEIRSKKVDATYEEISAYAGECPWPQPAGRKSVFRPGGCYYTMICRVAPYNVKGILYYQGETDAEFADRYYNLMDALIENWRALFRKPKLYFVITQLPMYIEKDASDDYSWAKLRDIQLRIYENTENTDLLVLADCGEYGNIHPVDKKTPGQRLGNMVLERLYQEEVRGFSMVPDKIYKESGSVIITFKNTYGTIIYNEDGVGNSCSKEQMGEVVGFEIADETGEYRQCNFDVCGERVIIRNAINAKYVRYGWCNYGKVVLTNAVGIPLSPFGDRIIQGDK